MRAAGSRDVRSDAARLRHDLLNQLNIIVGSTAILHGTALDDVQRQTVDRCRRAAKAMLHHLARLDKIADASGPRGLSALADQAAGHLQKPFDRAELLEAIGKAAARHPARILLVDDAPELAWLVRAALRGTGHTLVVETTGADALERFDRQPFDLVLMDFELPDGNGGEVATEMRRRERARHQPPTPMLLVTAHALDDAEAAGAGAAESSPPEAAADDERRVRVTDPELAPLVGPFLTDRRAELPALRQALAEGRHAEVEAVGHRLRGTGRSYGFPAISRLGGDLERLAHAGDPAAITRAIDALARYLEQVQVEIVDGSGEVAD